MHAQPIASIDEGVSPDELLDKGLVEIRLIWQVQLGDASFRDNTTVIRLKAK